MELATPVTPAPAPVPPAHPSLAPATGEQCPACGAQVAADQRYCLECGQRRGDPRLPFMDALVFKDALAQRPPEPPPTLSSRRRQRMSPNATLIAGVGTLMLALGVGVLIGHSGSHSASSGAPAVQVVKVPATGGATSTTAQASPSGGSAKAKKAKVSGGGGTQSAKSNPFLKTTKAAGKLPAPVVKVGSPGHGRGYKNGHFTGSFFGP